MYKHQNQPRLFVFIAVMALFMCVNPSLGQSDRELREENQRLKAQVKQIQEELSAVQSRVNKLEKQVKNLEKSLKTASKPTKKTNKQPQVEEKASIDESVASASPRALFNALKTGYEQAVANLDQGQQGDKNRKIYLKAVQRWVTTANRDYRARINWHVRVLGATPTKRGFAVELQAVDPKTNINLGDPFFALLSKGLAKRYDNVIQRSGVEVVELKGTLHPNVGFDRNKSKAGPFEKTKFLGPFAQFNFEVVATSLQPPTKVGE